MRQDMPLGVVARFGVECMVAHPEGEAVVVAAPVAGLGLRAGLDFEVVGLWVGLDVRQRLTTLRVGRDDPIVASALSASISFGVRFIDSKPK
jgi:hypothetical protein